MRQDASIARILTLLVVTAAVVGSLGGVASASHETGEGDRLSYINANGAQVTFELQPQDDGSTALFAISGNFEYEYEGATTTVAEGDSYIIPAYSSSGVFVISDAGTGEPLYEAPLTSPLQETQDPTIADSVPTPDVTVGTDGTGDFATLSAALNNTNDGATIQLKDGFHAASDEGRLDPYHKVPVPENVTITGDGDGGAVLGYGLALRGDVTVEAVKLEQSSASTVSVVDQGGDTTLRNVWIAADTSISGTNPAFKRDSSPGLTTFENVRVYEPRDVSGVSGLTVTNSTVVDTADVADGFDNTRFDAVTIPVDKFGKTTQPPAFGEDETISADVTDEFTLTADASHTGENLSYSWVGNGDLADVTTDSVNQTATYATAGSYTVDLTATDPATGLSTTKTFTVDVEDPLTESISALDPYTLDRVASNESRGEGGNLLHLLTIEQNGTSYTGVIVTKHTPTNGTWNVGTQYDGANFTDPARVVAIEQSSDGQNFSDINTTTVQLDSFTITDATNRMNGETVQTFEHMDYSDRSTLLQDVNTISTTAIVANPSSSEGIASGDSLVVGGALLVLVAGYLYARD